MTYTPTLPKKITLTRNTGFTEVLAAMLKGLAAERDEDPRVTATIALEEGIAAIRAERAAQTQGEDDA